MSDVVVRAVRPEGPAVGFDLTENETLEGGLGGWAVVDRPKRRAALEWVGTPSMALHLPVILEGYPTLTSVEGACEIVESWGLPAAGQQEPPILQVTGQVRVAAGVRWVLDSVDWGEQIRERGVRVRQELVLHLLRHTDLVVRLSPALRARDRAG